MVRLKDLFNKTINKNNKEVSLHLKKKRLCELDLDIDDILDIKIKDKLNKW